MPPKYTRLSGDALAVHPDWKMITSDRRRTKTGRRLYHYRPDKLRYGEVLIYDSGVLVFIFNKIKHRLPLPETYAGFLKAMNEFKYIQSRQATDSLDVNHSTYRPRGWDGATGLKIQL